MSFVGKAFVLGDHVNTDEIIAARYLTSQEGKWLGQHCLEDIRPGFGRRSDLQGSILVAGKNFGCGSSREHAPMAILGCGIRAVIARSFARIFLRNAINIGLPVFELNHWQDIEEGDLVGICPQSGEIWVGGKEMHWKTTPYPDFLEKVIRSGGWMKYLAAGKAHSSAMDPQKADIEPRSEEI